MDSFVVRGGNKLFGEVKISGAKNAALPIMAASLLTEDKLILTNVPKLVDINTMISLLQNHGTNAKWIDTNSVELSSENITNKKAPYEIVRKMRASIWVLGPLLARFGVAEVSLPGGCAIGVRMIDQHLKVMESLGAEINNKNGYITAKINGRLKGTKFHFEKISVGATINAIFAATLADGETILSNCAYEPEIVDTCNLLVKMGADISGIGTSKVTIVGKEKLYGAQHEIIGDRIEAGTFLAALGLCGGEIELTGIDYSLLENIILKFAETGLVIDNLSDRIVVKSDGEVKAVDVSTEAYPGFATDLQAQYMSMMTIANGTSIITENIFENRFMHVPELLRMGCDISLEGSSAIIKGVNELVGAEVMASDLRASSSLVIAGLRAKGETKVRRIYHLDRGYEKLEDKLSKCGADVERIIGDYV